VWFNIDPNSGTRFFLVNHRIAAKTRKKTQTKNLTQSRKGKREEKIHHRDTEYTEADSKAEDGTGRKGSALIPKAESLM
jgi:hypothetical protein